MRKPSVVFWTPEASIFRLVRLLSNAFSDFGSVGRKRKKRNKKHWKRSLELGGPVSQRNIRGGGYKVNMAAMEEGKIDVVVKLKREQRKKDEPPKLYGKKIAYVSIAFCITFFF